MISMLPLCHPSSMFMPRMMGVPSAIAPMTPIVAPPAACSPSHRNMCMTNEYDSHMYGRFRHIGRDYRHVPFDWYRPPKQQHNVIHEDAAVVTLNGPVPIGDFYRYYIYGGRIDDEQQSVDYRHEAESTRTYNAYRRVTFPPDDDDFIDTTSVNSAYGN